MNSKGYTLSYLERKKEQVLVEICRMSKLITIFPNLYNIYHSSKLLLILIINKSSILRNIKYHIFKAKNQLILYQSVFLNLIYR